jgi:hypothetical protein
MLTYFACRLGEIVKKPELIHFLQRMRVSTIDPQPRHLGMQNGFDFLVAGCVHPKQGRKLRRGEYCLLSICGAPRQRRRLLVVVRHRVVKLSDREFARLKKRHDMRCALCGSREGEPHFKNSRLQTRLERGHMDPRKELTVDNCLPTCSMCNAVYQDKAVFNRNGFIKTWLQRKS